MKRAAFALCLGLALVVGFVVNIRRASAQTPQPTPNPTQSTPVPVPNPVNGVICPPEGAVTDTNLLDPEYAAMCWMCFAQPTPTSEYNLGITPISTGVIPTFSIGTPVSGTVTPTGAATFTPTTTFTPTPTATARPYEFQEFANLQHTWTHPLGVYEFHYSFAWVNDQDVAAITFEATKVDSPAGDALKMMADTFSYLGNQPWGNTTGSKVGNYCISSDGLLPVPYNSGEAICAAVAPGYTYYEQNNATYRLQNLVRNTNGKAGFSCYDNPSYERDCSVNLHLWYYGESPLPTFTPVPTPTATTTPGVLDCSDPVFRDTTPAVEVEGTEYIGTSCPIDFPGFTITTPEIVFSAYTLTVPYLKVCVDWYSFPAMDVFGFQFTAMIIFFPLLVFAVLFIMRI